MRRGRESLDQVYMWRSASREGGGAVGGLTPASLAAAASNVVGKLRGGLADLRPVPRVLIGQGPNRSVYRMISSSTTSGQPVLLVPPLAAPALCFDLRRGCSLAEHLVDGGRPTYLVDYGTVAFADRRLGIEHWIVSTQ